MKLEVTHENLAKALSNLARIVGVRSTLPVLNNVLLATEKGRLRLSATDLEIGMTTWIGAKIAKEGSFTVPAKLFGDLMATAAGKTILLEQRESTLQVVAGESEAGLKGLPADEFPTVPEITNEPLLTISPLILKENLKKTVVACALDESRPALSGVLFWVDGKSLRLAATDSYRLSEAKIDIGPGKRAELKFIVPQRAIQEVIRLSEDGEEQIAIALSENQALFRTPNFSLVSRLLEGEFPKYGDIIPASGTTTCSLETEEFLRAIKVGSLFAREVGNHITLEATAKKPLTVRAASPQAGENKTTVPATVSGDSLSVSFNARYLADAVGTISSKLTEVTLTGKTSPAVFREEGNQNFLHLVMPLRVEG